MNPLEGNDAARISDGPGARGTAPALLTGGCPRDRAVEAFRAVVARTSPARAITSDLRGR
ncbi:hypothetical protein [Streptomyces sp. NPDC051567]|uniref:hypothetical protein n=1 Tax=Streptomyces sp. NPDC051567 TaxID=3365660 RepID=UPI00379CA298